jgi:hypothetical protein
MSLFPLKPTHKPVLAYYASLDQFHQDGHKTEGNTRSAFADLLKKCASPYDWHLVEEYQFKGTNKQPPLPQLPRLIVPYYFSRKPKQNCMSSPQTSRKAANPHITNRI